MECLLCDIRCFTQEVLKNHYQSYHFVDTEDQYFKDLFLPDTIEKTCKSCNLTFKNCRTKKIHMFLFHYSGKNQTGGSRQTSRLPLNVLKRRTITYYSINFEQHKNFYDFFSSDILDSFIQSVYEKFTPDKECKFQGFAEIVNQQMGEIILTDRQVWLTNVFNSRHFNEFVRGQIRDEIAKRLIVNDQTGSSWHFRRFERLTVIVVRLEDSVKLLLS